MRTRVLIAAVLLAILVSASAAALSWPYGSAAANRAAASRDAARLLAQVRLPAGAHEVSREPPGDGGALASQGGFEAGAVYAERHGWWVVPEAPDTVLAFVRSHAPAGAGLEGWGSGSNPHGTGTSTELLYTWAPVPARLGLRSLRVEMTALPSGHTGVLAQAESVWLVPRPRDERVPAGAREIAITVRTFGGAQLRELTVTAPARVRALVTLLNALPTLQPGVSSCPAFTVNGSRTITIMFRTRPGGPILAQARYLDYPPLDTPSAACTAIDFSVGGHARTPLVGGDFVGRLDRLLGVNLTGGR